MSRALFERLDKNTAWKAFRHSESLGDIFTYFGMGSWITTALVMVATFMTSLFSNLPSWGKILLGAALALMVLLAMAIVAVMRSGNDTGSDPTLAGELESASPEPQPQPRGTLNLIVSVSLVVLALGLGIWMSVRRESKSTGVVVGGSARPLQTESIASPEAATVALSRPGTLPTSEQATPSAQLSLQPTPAQVGSIVVSPSPAPLIVSAPNGIAIGGGTVHNPTVNNFAANRPPPSIKWEQRSIPPWTGSMEEQNQYVKNPGVDVAITTLGPFDRPAFEIECSTSCEAVDFRRLGNTHVEYKYRQDGAAIRIILGVIDGMDAETMHVQIRSRSSTAVSITKVATFSR